MGLFAFLPRVKAGKPCFTHCGLNGPALLSSSKTFDVTHVDIFSLYASWLACLSCNLYLGQWSVTFSTQKAT